MNKIPTTEVFWRITKELAKEKKSVERAPGRENSKRSGKQYNMFGEVQKVEY